jgi:tetratricopeptide (TPR) repeat protein
VRLYVAGAVEFKLGARDATGLSAHHAAAMSWFKRVLQLPEAQRSSRAVWATYMAGRIEARGADAAAAAHSFQQVRTLATQGMPDPLGLAVASYGEEARLALQAGEIPHAVDLYLQQAARGSSVALSSLREIADQLARDPDLTLRHIRDARIQKLWLAGIVAAGFDGSFYAGRDAAGPGNAWSKRIDAVVAGIDRGTFPELDRLAAIAYATGRFDLAASLARGIATPLASVVRAKLALRAGNRQDAAKEFAFAIGHRKDAEAQGTQGGMVWSRLLAENGVLAMSRSDYASALQSLMEAGSEHWLDAAYVAERVMSLDELADFARQHVPASTMPDRRVSQDPYWHQYFGRPPDPARALRLLLARRQMREQRFDEAVENFHENDVALDKEHPSLAAVAAEYAAAIRGSTRSWTRIGRAEALFEAAALAKQFGMELLGYELAPDFATFDGAFTLDTDSKPDSYTSANEVVRITANPPPATRFHYRIVAFDLAQRSADDLPPRSQAFAAVLCANLRWARQRDDMERATTLYRRYVREAAYVPWSRQFGGRCEAPDFRRASAMLWHARWDATRAALRPYRIPLEVMAVVMVLAGGALLVRWQRRRRASSSA